MKIIITLFIICILSSCSNFSDSDLKNASALITLEGHLQISNQSESWKSVQSYLEIKDLLQDRSMVPKRSFRLIEIKNMMETIDRESNFIISQIDNIKLEILKIAGEDLKVSIKDQGSHIVISKSEMELFRGKIMSLNLTAIKDKLNVNSVDKVIFSNSTDVNLWKNYNRYIRFLLKTLSSYSDGKFSFNPKMAYKGPTARDYVRQFEKDLNNSKANLQDDEHMLIELFTDLFKSNKVKNEEGDEMSWMEYKFRGATIISAISELTALQNDILKSKSFALRHINSRITNCSSYSFTKFLPIVSGPSNAQVGKEVEIKIRMGVYDEYETPVITSSRPSVWLEGDGAGTVRFKAKKGVNKLSGTIIIQKKSGELSTRPWEWSVYGVEEK
jgi:hypothetical protein